MHSDSVHSSFGLSFGSIGAMVVSSFWMLFMLLSSFSMGVANWRIYIKRLFFIEYVIGVLTSYVKYMIRNFSIITN